MALFLSAGHYPAAPGAAWKGFVEHDEALLWAWKLISLIPKAQFVPPTELSAKVRWINARAKVDDLALEIHFNAATPTARGSETLYCPGSAGGMIIASGVQSAIAQFFSPDRGIKPGWYQGNPTKGPLAFLSQTRCAALIIEPEFIYRAEDIRANRAACCAAIAESIRRFA